MNKKGPKIELWFQNILSFHFRALMINDLRKRKKGTFQHQLAVGWTLKLDQIKPPLVHLPSPERLHEKSHNEKSTNEISTKREKS